jgi:hypothetical protein
MGSGKDGGLMTAIRIEVHLRRKDSTKDIVTEINAFGKKFVFNGIISQGIDQKDVVAVYLPEGG